VRPHQPVDPRLQLLPVGPQFADRREQLADHLLQRGDVVGEWRGRSHTPLT
jgi:hypothetical protein